MFVIVAKDELATYKSTPDELPSTNLSSNCKSNNESGQQTKGVKTAPQVKLRTTIAFL